MLDVDPEGSSDEDDRRMGMSAFAAVEDWDERILEDLSGASAAMLRVAQSDVLCSALNDDIFWGAACRDQSDGQSEWS